MGDSVESRSDWYRKELQIFKKQSKTEHVMLLYKREAQWIVKHHPELKVDIGPYVSRDDFRRWIRISKRR